MKNAYFKEGFYYIRTDLCPYHVNNFNSKGSNIVKLIRHNSNLWHAELRDAESSKTFPVIIDLDGNYSEYTESNSYNNFQFVTDLFDIILTKKSEFRNFDYDHVIQEYPRTVDIYTDNRYTARLVHKNRNMVILTNPPSRSCKSLINKSKKLINLLGNYV